MRLMAISLMPLSSRAWVRAKYTWPVNQSESESQKIDGEPTSAKNVTPDILGSDEV